MDPGVRPLSSPDGGDQTEVMITLARPRQGRVLAGVCAAIARRFGWSPTVVRVLTVLGVVFAGVSVLAYLLLWVLIPQE